VPRTTERLFGSYQLEHQLDAPGIFSEKDLGAFAKRFAEIRPLYDAYLAKLQKGVQ
jgi:hypothetical protein